MRCIVDTCTTDIIGLEDGWTPSNRDGPACNDCWEYYRDHGHWPDEDAICSECQPEGSTDD